MQNRQLKVAGALVALVLAFTLGWYAAGAKGMNAALPDVSTGTTTLDLTALTSTGSHPDISQFWKAWDILNENFVQTHGSTTPTDQQKIYGAIAGLTSSFGD